MEILTSIIVPTQNRLNDVIRCVDSILEIKDQSIEVVVVDNASTDGTYSELMSRYGNNSIVKIIFSDRNLGAGGGRNLGASKAAGKFLLFVDSDNVIDCKMPAYLKESLEMPNTGLVGPLMLYGERPDRIWTYFADINPWTSRAFYLGNKEEYSQDLPLKLESGHIPNCFMVSKEDFEKVGGFDEYYIVMYEEADFAEKIKRLLEKKVVIDTRAITYHYVEFEQQPSDGYILGIRNRTRAYLLARNRIHFVRNNFKPVQKIFFYLIMNNIVAGYYCFNFLRSGKWDLTKGYLKGILDGFRRM